METINIDKMFIFDQIKFQEILLNRKDTLEWWNQLNDFILNSRNKSYFPQIKESKKRILRTKNGLLWVPVTRFVFQGKSFIHPLQDKLIKSNNEEVFSEAIKLFKNGLSQLSIANKIYSSAFDYTTLGKRIKKKQYKKQSTLFK